MVMYARTYLITYGTLLGIRQPHESSALHDSRPPRKGEA